MFEKEAERKIREAIDKGELDSYEGKGKPFPEEFWEQNAFIPGDVRQSYKILKNASMVPQEVTLKKRIEEIKKILSDQTLDQETAKVLRLELQQKEVEFNIKLESFRTLGSRK